MTKEIEDGGAAYDHQDFYDDCFMCGGSGILDDTCVCNAYEDTCCCAEPEPMECPECLHNAQSKDLADAMLKARKEPSNG